MAALRSSMLSLSQLQRSGYVNCVGAADAIDARAKVASVQRRIYMTSCKCLLRDSGGNVSVKKNVLPRKLSLEVGR